MLHPVTVKSCGGHSILVNVWLAKRDLTFTSANQAKFVYGQHVVAAAFLVIRKIN